MNNNQTNTYRKDLSWLYFDDEPRVQERYQVKERQSCIPAFVAYRAIPSSNKQHQSGRDNSIPCMVVLYRDIQSKLKLLRGSFNNRDNVWTPIQFRTKSQPQHPKRWFFLNNRPIHFHINSTSVIRPAKQNQLSFSSLEINKPLPVLMTT